VVPGVVRGDMTGACSPAWRFFTAGINLRGRLAVAFRFFVMHGRACQFRDSRLPCAPDI
jgi:hypothetical protein